MNERSFKGGEMQTSEASTSYSSDHLAQNVSYTFGVRSLGKHSQVSLENNGSVCARCYMTHN